MSKLILLITLCFNLFALEISLDSAKDNFVRYSILHLSNKQDFVCQEISNDFKVITEVVCAFSKKPSQNIKKIQNDFFRLNSFIKNNTFFISIKPFHKIKLRPEVFNLCRENSIYDADVKLSKRWMLIGYKDKSPLINKKKIVDSSINFPFFMDKDKLPYVGSLDIKGNPVYIKKVGDVRDYLRVKKLYQDKKYESCMDIVQEILEEYPNTLFKAELIYYKIKLYSKLEDSDNVVSNAKVYLRNYSGDENIPEVLALVAKAYADIGMPSDADYFFERLFSEHANSVFTQWGYIYKGDMFVSSGVLSKVTAFYKKALYGTDNIDVATAAAYRLAKVYQEVSLKESAKYIDKIVQAKPSYFKEDYRSSKVMMHTFEDNANYDIASKIATALLDTIDPTYDDYEILLSEKALWLAELKDKQIAVVALNKYIKQFPDGDYIAKVQIAKDKLFFETSDLNTSMRLAEYNKLIEEYQYDSIGNRAIYEKAKLLLNEKLYGEVLDIKEDVLSLNSDDYSDTQIIINDAAVGVMENFLKDKECNKVLVVSNEYNITLSNKWDDGVYDCSMKGGDYQLAKSIAVKNFKSKDLELRKKWLYRYIKVDFATGNYSDVLEASKDLTSLIEDDKNSSYKDVYRYIFDTYDRLEKKDKMIPAIIKIEEVFGLDYIDIERYISIMSIGSDTKDDNIVIKYGSKVMDIQTSSSSTAQSPYVEFALYQAYMNKENYLKALSVIKSLDRLDELAKTDFSRQKYLLGVVYSKLWRDDEAQSAYKSAIKADSKSAWAKLAKSATEL